MNSTTNIAVYITPSIVNSTYICFDSSLSRVGGTAGAIGGKRKAACTTQSQSATNKKPKAASSKADSVDGDRFVVWSSNGYANDGWHNNDNPEKHICSSHATLARANKAAYDRFVENPWGLEKDEFSEHVMDYVFETTGSGLDIHSCWSTGEAEYWKVGVCHKKNFSATSWR